MMHGQKNKLPTRLLAFQALSAAQSIQCRIAGSSVNRNGKGYGRKRLSSRLTHYPGICLEEMSEMTKTVLYDSCCDRYLKPGLSK